jgi:MFS transporter, DHA1 family, tetracycline resistance protein
MAPVAEMAPAPAPPPSKRILGVVFLTLFLDLLGFGVILPIQPFYAESFGASATVVTLIGATYSLMQFLFAPVWGRLSDRIGRRPVVLISIAFACLGWLVLGFAANLWMLVAARTIAGFGNANLGTVQAIVADVTPPKDRARGMGLIGAAFGLGFLFGPVVGGFFGSRYGPEVPAFISAGLAAFNWIVAFAFLKETRRPHAAPDPHLRRTLFPGGALKRAFGVPNVGPLLTMGFVYAVGFSLMEAGLALFMERQFIAPDIFGTPAGHAEAARLTMWVLFVVGMTAVVVQGGLIRPLRKRFSERSLLLAGTALIVPGFLGIGGLPFADLPYATMLPISILIAAGSGLFSPASTSLLSQSVGDDEQGGVLGVGQSIQSLGRIVGPGFSGLLLDLHRAVPFLVGAALLSGAFLLALRVKNPSELPGRSET